VNYDNNNRGVLFKNDKKGNEKRPDYRGTIVVDNTDFNISGWIKRSQKTGDSFMSLSIEPKKAAPPKPVPEKPQMTEENWDDLDTPF
jgi:uncharacterized protein (DUF736 family)